MQVAVVFAVLSILFHNGLGYSHVKQKVDRPFGFLSNRYNRVRRSTQVHSTKLDFLEANPYYDLTNLPMNTFKHAQPNLGTVISAEKIVKDDAPGDVYHVVLDHGGNMPYWEGQSIGVLPPGTNPKTGKPQGARLYSIASTRYGDAGDGRTVSLCVRRAVFVDPETGKEDETKAGLCSNLLCHSSPGDVFRLIGPTGKVMLIPEHTPEADLIMIATGTGVAPYRGFMNRLFVEKTLAGDNFKGDALLYLGIPASSSMLYGDLWASIAEKNKGRFKFIPAISREQKTECGDKMYVQNRIEQDATEIFERMQKGAHMYFCGLKGMMPGILETMKSQAEKRGLEWEGLLKTWKAEKRWHVEVY